MDVIVHKRIMERHPELTEQDVLDAWENAFTYATRTHCARPFETMALGYDGKSRLIEMIALPKNACWMIYHAMTPPSRKFLTEMQGKR